tara:strand:- start:302 stop:1267 length:966 start_codon:yes stop_codon:yes gene_type:complete
MDDALKNNTLKIIERDQGQFDTVYDRQSDIDAPKTVEKVTVTEQEDGTWTKDSTEVASNLKDERVIPEKEAQFEGDAQTLRDFTAITDRKLIGIASQIDEKKRLIITLSTAAGAAHSTASGLKGCWSTAEAGSPVIGTTTQWTNIKEEVEWIKIYDNMAGANVNSAPNYALENPFDPDNQTALDTSSYVNVGYGYSNTPEAVVFKDNTGSATGSDTDGSGAGIGTNGRFDLKTAGLENPAGPQDATFGNCAALASSIANIYGEIISLRLEMNDMRDKLNIVKDKKLEKELMNWGCKNMRSESVGGSSDQTATTNAIVGLTT